MCLIRFLLWPTGKPFIISRFQLTAKIRTNFSQKYRTTKQKIVIAIVCISLTIKRSTPHSKFPFHLNNNFQAAFTLSINRLFIILPNCQILLKSIFLKISENNIYALSIRSLKYKYIKFPSRYYHMHFYIYIPKPQLLVPHRRQTKIGLLAHPVKGSDHATWQSGTPHCANLSQRYHPFWQAYACTWGLVSKIRRTDLNFFTKFFQKIFIFDFSLNS